MVWTREIALLAGSHVEAISAVLAVFFGGLAAGARWLGPLADRSASPLRTYGALELAAGALALASLFALRALGGLALPRAGTLAAASATLLPVTFLLGGTLPALVRAAVRELADAARRAGWTLGANTAGSLLGVGVAVAAIPTQGLRATGIGAALVSMAIGLAALVLGRGAPRPALAAAGASGRAGSRLALAAAGAAGGVTLAYEVVAARMAALLLGSSLYAWGAVLALFLAGLAAGNAGFAPRASRSATPGRDLGWIEIASAMALAAGLGFIAPPPARAAAGLAAGPLLAVALGVLPAAFLMGAAFPFFVRLAAGTPRLAAEFGALSAVNTAGGIAGALLAPFVLLPALGPSGATLSCAAVAAVLGAVFLTRGERASGLRAALALAAVALAALPALRAAPGSLRGRVLFVDHGRQASAAVVHVAGRRDLIVDGDPEASTGGDARATEELLAALPLALHPRPRRFLELGLGSGITLARAARFPLERVDCVEIAASVRRAAPYFAPDNDGIAAGVDPRVRVIPGDARAFLLLRPAGYDVIVANTLHPWSVGATGLYSREYFGRVAAALRPGGIAAQWLPVSGIGSEGLAAILRTFFAVFPEGGLWWGAGNLIALGSRAPLPEPNAAALASAARPALERAGIPDAGELARRRLADARGVREALGEGALLRDDRPWLEASAARSRARGGAAALPALERIAAAGARADPAAGSILLWIESRVAREAGDAARADRLERLAVDAGLALARRERAARRVQEGSRALDADRLPEAGEAFRLALNDVPDQRDARFGRAALALREQRPADARDELEALLAAHPSDAEAWNQLASVRHALGDAPGARRAVDRALAADPFFPQALANAGLLALAAGERDAAEAMLARLRALSPLGTHPEERALAAALQAGTFSPS